MDDGGIVVVPGCIVGAFDSLFVGFEVRRALGSGVLVRHITLSLFSYRRHLKDDVVDFEAVTLGGVFVAAVQLCDVSGDDRLSDFSAGSSSSASIGVISCVSPISSCAGFLSFGGH